MPAYLRRLTGLLPSLNISPSRATTLQRCPTIRAMASGPSLPLQHFPSSGFVRVDSNEKIEEEELPAYRAENFYPAHIGEVFKSRYQVVSKLGYGMSSTAWLCRDLHDQSFYTLKVCARNQRPDHEIAVSEHLSKAGDHFGKQLIRLVLDSFEVSGPHGKHTCLIHQPLGMSFTEFQNLCDGNRMPKEMIQRSLQLTSISLAFLHENSVVHTDISTNNILLGIDDTSILSQIEEDEIQRPVARKILDDRQIYYSRPVPVSKGLPVLSDLGEARIGTVKQKGDIMPGIYRAPEVILDMEWDTKVDIWAMGVMAWDMVEGGHLFSAKKDRTLNDEQHLAEMVSLMGSPPPEFIQRSAKAQLYWDIEGNWKGSVPVPTQCLDEREQFYHGEDKVLFLNFLRKIMCWLPESRPTAEELAYDDFLMQPLLRERAST